MPETETKLPKKFQPILKSLIEIFALPLIVYAVMTAIIAGAVVQGDSMQPNYHSNMLVFAARPDKPDHDDVILIRSKTLDEVIIKRVIGLPGDTIEIKNGTTYRNGQPVNQEYTVYPDTRDTPLLTVPDDAVFVMGDNRPNSLDSRSERLGPIPADEVIGVVFFHIG